MEDDSSARVNVTERMPGYGRDGASLRESSGIRSTDFGRDVRSEPKVPASSLLLSSKDVLEFHKHKHESCGNNKASNERESIRAVDILRRNFGDPKDPEKVETGFEIEPEESDHEKDEEGKTVKPNLEDPEVADGNLNIDCKRGEELKEHVYCTVYCIANDNYRIPVENTSDNETSRSPSSSSDVLVSLPTDSDLSDREPYPVPYTVSDLVSGLNSSYNANNSVSVVLTCRICLDDRLITPLHCCKKAVCEECLKRYISSQVFTSPNFIASPLSSFALFCGCLVVWVCIYL